MSVCSCSWDSYCIGDCVMRNRIARKILSYGRSICPNCESRVEVGMRCVDHSGLYEDGGGWFQRFHEECFELMERFGEKVCNGGWHWPFDLVEASQHALSQGDDPFWREWLEIYEKTWAWTPEPADPRPISVEVLAEHGMYLERLAKMGGGE